jgi:lipid II:glycine glycyltransferase (peptidoglycan interpeptide bridge formation enzyme)
MLVKETSVAPMVAHIPQGPVLKSLDPRSFDLIFNCLIEIVQSEKIRYLILNPSRNGCSEKDLNRWKFRVSRILPSEKATLVLDLSQGPDLLLKRMRRTTRNNIRIAEDRGVTIRQGNEDDLEGFYRLLVVTSRRQRFQIQGKEYYLNLWRLLEPHKHIKMFIAEYAGEMLSCLMTIPFGDSVVVKNFVWIGDKKWLRPNELLFWKVIDWSRANGFHRFDFGGINLSVAQALLGDSSPSASATNSNTRFILGFGRSIVLLPSTYEYVPNQMLDSLLNGCCSILSRYDLMKDVRRIVGI